MINTVKKALDLGAHKANIIEVEDISLDASFRICVSQMLVVNMVRVINDLHM